MKITILGNGAWGRGLAFIAEKAGHDVGIWSRRAPDERLIINADAFILALPTQDAHVVLQGLNLGGRPLISAAKGIERSSGKFLHELGKDVAAASEFYALSGPSFAADVVQGLPTAVTLAGPTLEKAAHWAKALSLPTFRIYATDDVIGVEIGGAMKNVLAIACGISDGLKLGDSARASLTTRGFAELSRFGRKLGARPETLVGLSGLGDLLLTCSSTKSRNYSFGLALGKGHPVQDALAHSKGVVEGAFTASIAAKLSRQHQIEMPIVEAVSAIVDHGSKPGDEVKKLLARPLGTEFKKD
jgi:glycerol-3-phosphate dehydrogenase (NAD(P)+)